MNLYKVSSLPGLAPSWKVVGWSLYIMKYQTWPSSWWTTISSGIVTAVHILTLKGSPVTEFLNIFSKSVHELHETFMNGTFEVEVETCARDIFIPFMSM